jgi:hypothetical protein
MNASLDERWRREFFDLATQYYVAARLAARGSLIPVTGNLFHHAVEMYLKAALIGTLSLDEMKRRYSHDLVALWNRFKTKEPDPALARFDLVVAVLDKFDNIRYPDETRKGQGQAVLLAWGPMQPGGPTEWSQEPGNHGIWISDIDVLVMEVIQRSGVSPTLCAEWAQRHDNARDALEHQNPLAAKWR